MRMIKSHNPSHYLLITLLFLLGCSTVPHSTNYKPTSAQLSTNEIKSNQPIIKRNIGSISEIILKKAISEYRNHPWSGVSMNRYSGTIKIPTGTLHRTYEDQHGVYFESPNGKYLGNFPVGIFVPYNDQDSPVPYVYHMTLNGRGYEIGDTPAEVQFTSESANNQVIDPSKVKKDDQVRDSQTNDATNKVLSESLESNRKQAELEEQLRLSQQQSQATTPIASAPSIGKRIALVVGNANYKVRPLKPTQRCGRYIPLTSFQRI